MAPVAPVARGGGPATNTAAVKPEEATCRAYVLPKLKAAGWDSGQHAIVEQLTFTDGRILVRGRQAVREEKKRAGWLLGSRRGGRGRGRR